MIGLMRDARLRVSEAAALTWGDVRRLHGDSGQTRVGGADETKHREVSADTMRLLLSIRHGVGDAELILDMRPNQLAVRIGATARQAGLGPGYSGFRKVLFVLRDVSEKRGKSLAEYSVRNHSHLIPNDVEILEYDDFNMTAAVVYVAQVRCGSSLEWAKGISE